MKVILIDPFSAIMGMQSNFVREVEMDQSDYRDIYRLLSAPGQRKVSTFQAIYPHTCGVPEFAPSDVIYVDEEGLLFPVSAVFALKGWPEPCLIGRGLVVGTDRTGDSAEPETRLETVRKLVIPGFVPPKDQD